MFASLAFLLIGLDEVVLGLFLLIFVWDFVLSTPLSLGIFDFQGCLIPGPFSALWMKGTNFSPQFSFLVFLRHLSRKTRLKQVLLLNRKFAFLHFLQLTYIEFLIGWDVILLLPVSPSPAEWPRDLPRKTEPWRLKWSQDKENGTFSGPTKTVIFLSSFCTGIGLLPVSFYDSVCLIRLLCWGILANTVGDFPFRKLCLATVADTFV